MKGFESSLLTHPFVATYQYGDAGDYLDDYEYTKATEQKQKSTKKQ